MGIDEFARKILDRLDQPVLVINRSFEIVYANRSVQEHVQVLLDEIIGRPCFDVTHRSKAACDSTTDVACPVKEAFRTGKRSTATHKHLYDERLVVEEIVATPLAGEDLVIEELRDISHLLGLVDGILPICSSCKRVRDGDGNWRQIEGYMAEHTGADFSHGLCPDCLQKLYPDFKHGR